MNSRTIPASASSAITTGDRSTEIAALKRWEDCSPEEQEQRRVNFGQPRDDQGKSDRYDAELLRRHIEGLPLSKGDTRKAKRMVRELKARS
jgi:hypothetical protein